MAATTNHEKARIALYYFMLGRGYHNACRAMSYAEGLHNGMRKDKVTPEFAHQVWIANFLRTLPVSNSLLDIALAVAFLHDTSEDKDVSFAEVARDFGDEVADGVDRMTKVFRGDKVNTDLYFKRLGETAVSALVKGVDRLHNLSSMVGVFTIEKQRAYIAETRAYHLPMLKNARKRFPELEAAFENIKQSLNSRIDLIEAIHVGMGHTDMSTAAP
jgi:(p)ppGpp synthase/HD superfamily hydrolase